jgi:hypothetical protein
VSWGYRIASLLVFVILALVFFASLLGWGVRSDASARAASVRMGGVRTGGPGFGK